MTHNPEPSMAYVVGLHVGPTRVAVAVITKRVDGSCIANTASFTSRAPRGEERVADLAGCVDHAVCAAQLAVIAPADGSATDPLRHAVLAALSARGVEVVELYPREELSDLAELWPSVTLADTGETAALGLAQLGTRLAWITEQVCV